MLEFILIFCTIYFVTDDFVLVVCDVCGYNVKIEAFESHVRQRHGHRAATVRLSELKRVENRIKECRVNLDKKGSGDGYNPKTFVGGECISTTGNLSLKQREMSESLSAPSSMSSSSSSSHQLLPPPQRPPSSRSKTPTPDRELFLPCSSNSNSSSSSNSASSTPIGQIVTSTMALASTSKTKDSAASRILDIEQPMDVDDVENIRQNTSAFLPNHHQSDVESMVSRSIAAAAAAVAAQTSSGPKPSS